MSKRALSLSWLVGMFGVIAAGSYYFGIVLGKKLKPQVASSRTAPDASAMADDAKDEDGADAKTSSTDGPPTSPILSVESVSDEGEAKDAKADTARSETEADNPKDRAAEKRGNTSAERPRAEGRRETPRSERRSPQARTRTERASTSARREPARAAATPRSTEADRASRTTGSPERTATASSRDARVETSVPVVVPSSDSAAPAAEKPKYRVQVGAYESEANARARAGELAGKGYWATTRKAERGGKTLYVVQVGAYPKRGNADRVRAELVEQGFDAHVSVD